MTSARKAPPRVPAKPAKPICDHCKKVCAKGLVRTKDGTYCSPKHRDAARTLRKIATPEPVDVGAAISTALARRGVDAASRPLPTAPPLTNLQKSIMASWFGRKSEDTRNTYRWSVRHFCKWLVARKLAADGDDDIAIVAGLFQRPKIQGNAIVEQWITAQLDEVKKPKRERKLRSVSAIATRCSGVKALCKALEGVNVIAYVPTFNAPRRVPKSALERFKEYEGVPEAYTTVMDSLWERVERKDATPEDVRDCALFTLASVVGMRRIEIVRLDHPGDLDLEARLITLLGKGRDQQEQMPVAKGAIPILMRWVVLRGEAPGPLFYGSAKKARPVTKRMGRYVLNRILKTESDKYGVKLRPHDVRRVMCTDTIGEVGMEAALPLTRHADPKTAKMYDLNQGRNIAATADAVGELVMRRGRRR